MKVLWERSETKPFLWDIGIMMMHARCYRKLKEVRTVLDKENRIEDRTTEIAHTFHKSDGQTTNTVNVEQNINVVNIEMGKQTFVNKIDLESIKEWIYAHMVQVIIGGILILYTVILLVMMLTMARYKDIIRKNEEEKIVTENTVQETVGSDEGVEETEPIKIESAVVQEMKETANEIKAAEVTESVTEKELYDLFIVGDTASEKRVKAVNTVGEELENVYYLTGGFYTETVGFYLNGKYDHFTGSISCDEECKGGFNINIYLDEGPCLQTIRVERLMTKIPIDIDTTGASFIKFEITGSMYSQGAILSDGLLHIADSEVNG